MNLFQKYKEFQNQNAAMKPLQCKPVEVGTMLYSRIGWRKSRNVFKVIYSKKGYLILDDLHGEIYPEPQISLGRNLFFSQEDIDESLEDLILEKKYRQHVCIEGQFDSNILKQRIDWIQTSNCDDVISYYERYLFRKTKRFMRKEYLEPAIRGETRLKPEYAEYSEIKSDIFKQHNISKKSLQLAEMLEEQPYFARMIIHKNQELYIGKHGVPEKIIAWDSPMAKYYYQRRVYISDTSLDIRLIRNIESEKGEYKYFQTLFEKADENCDACGVTIYGDADLGKILKNFKNDKRVKDIISTIMDNQYKIITEITNKNMLVLGCAGSGKTKILYHKISYMLSNNPDIKSSEVEIIAPTKLLIGEDNREMFQQLEIEECPTYSLTEYYYALIDRYKEQYKVTLNMPSIEKVELNDEYLIKELYTREGVQRLRDKYIEIYEMKNKSLLFEIQEYARDKVIDCYSSIFHKDVINVSDLFLNPEKEIKHYHSFIQLIQKYPKSNMQFKMTQIKKELEMDGNINTAEELKKEETEKVEELIARGKFLEYILDTFELPQETVFGKTGNPISSDQYFGELFSFLKSIQTISIDYNQFTSIRELDNRMREYLVLLMDVNMNKNFEIVNEYICKQVKASYQLRTESCYQLDAFITLLGLQSIYGALKSRQCYLYMDEVQEISRQELELLNRVYPNSFFTLFGDLDQCMNKKGLRNNDINWFNELKYDVRRILENYRNTKQVTRYLNEHYAMNMLPVGNDGNEVVVGGVELLKEASYEEDDRLCIITKSDVEMKSIMQYLEAIKKTYRVIRSEYSELQRGIFQIIPVQMCKGLEFDKVYVVMQNLELEEQYVAISRSLGDVYLIEVSM